VDKEGGVQATESKTRFIGTAVAVLISRRAADNDPIRDHSGAITGQSQNIGGRTLGGGMGLGFWVQSLPRVHATWAPRSVTMAWREPFIRP